MNQNTNVNVVPSYGQRGDLHFSQYDVGRTATINLYAVNEAYTIPLSATVKIQATKPSGLGFDVACTFSGSVVTVVSTETMTAEAGRFPCELHIIDNSDVIGTANFMFCVEASPHPDGVIDGDAEEVVNEIKALVLQSEGYALGTQDGVPVDNTSPYYHNNSKWWSEHPVGGGITDAVKLALLDCFENVVWINGDGQTFYDALQSALYPPANLVSISAVYTQTGIVYDNATLDSLKSDLVVTATYDDSSTAVVTTYALSGSLEVGTSTITVLYGDKSDSFTVNVTHAPIQYTITNNLTYVTNSNNASYVDEEDSYTATLSANAGYLMNSVEITMGGIDITNTAYDPLDGSVSIASATGNIVITALAIEDVGYISGVPYSFTITEDYTVDTTTFEIIPSVGNAYVQLPCKYADYIERYWSSFGGTGRIDFYDIDGNHVQGGAFAQNGLYGATVSNGHDIVSVILSGEKGRMANLTVTPYVYPKLGESTIWNANTIYAPEEVFTLTGSGGESGYLFVYGASTISISTGYTTSNIRGKFKFYDQNKSLISETSNADIIGGTAIWRTPQQIPAGTYYAKIELFAEFNGVQANYNPRIVLDRVVE